MIQAAYAAASLRVALLHDVEQVDVFLCEDDETVMVTAFDSKGEDTTFAVTLPAAEVSFFHYQSWRDGLNAIAGRGGSLSLSPES